MNIEIINKKNKTIFFKSKYGCAEGIWKSQEAPKTGKFSVEFSSDVIVDYSQINKNSILLYELRTDDGKTIISGCVDEIFEDLISVRVGDSYIDFESTIDFTDYYYVGDFITVRTKNLCIYDEGI